MQHPAESASRDITTAGASLPRLALLIALALTALPAIGAATFSRVPEMQVPPDIASAPRAQRATLRRHPAREQARAALRDWVVAHWPELSAVDYVSLSRYHVEATRGWRAPGSPSFGEFEVLAAQGNELHLMLRGPRLPASFDIVHRYVVFFARYDTATAQLSHQTLSIRGEVYE